MPDTGAPWNIPYVENADLVRDWPADSLLVANAVAAGLTAAGNPGIGSNVVQTVKTDTFTVASGTFTEVTGLTVTITPTSDSSKILVFANYTISNAEANRGVHSRLMRGATVLYVGNAAGSRVQSSGSVQMVSTRIVDNVTLSFLDNPAVNTAVTYSIQIRRGDFGTAVLGRSGEDTDGAQTGRMPASITAIEVAV